LQITSNAGIGIGKCVDVPEPETLLVVCVTPELVKAA